MTPIELIRKFIPTRIRIQVYVWVLSFAGRCKLLLYPLLYLLHGHIPAGVSIVNSKPVYCYEGIQIEAPRDSIEAYVEIFQDKVYDRHSVPQVGNTVIDIGAYVGMYSIKASQLVGLSGSVIAVEPLRDNLVYLRRNLEVCDNTSIVDVALSNYVGNGKLYSSPLTAAHSMDDVRKHFTEVQVTTMDNLVKSLGLGRVDYIKMDAEGSELYILEGAVEVLQNDSPILSLACYHTDADGVPYVGQVVVYLKRLGYKCIIEKGYVYAEREG